MKVSIKILAVLCVAVFIAGLAINAGYQTNVYMKQGGAEQVIASGGQITVESSGEIEIESGGTIDVESGGALKIAGTQITPSAAEFNYLDGSVAGTAVASKALVLDSAKRATGIVAYTDSSFADGDTLTVADYGKVFALYATTKKTVVLPVTTGGGSIKFIVDDADSLVIDANASQKLVDGTTEYEKETTVAGTVELISVDGTYWYMVGATGTWTGY